MARSRLLLWFPLLACLPVAGTSLLAQPKQDPISAGSASGGWSGRDPYPNSLQIKTEMSGSEAIPLNSGLVLVSNLVIKSFPLTGGKPRSVIEAPECSVDPQSNLAFSAGPLKVRAEDGKLF